MGCQWAVYLMNVIGFYQIGGIGFRCVVEIDRGGQMMREEGRRWRWLWYDFCAYGGFPGEKAEEFFGYVFPIG